MWLLNRNNELLPLCEDFPQTYNGRTASLEIPSATSADAGTYTCVLVNDSGRTECSCEVSVCVPPHLLSSVQFCTVICLFSCLNFVSVYRCLIFGNLTQVTVEHYSNDHDTPPSFVRRLEDLTVMDGDEVTLSVTLSGTVYHTSCLELC